MSVWQSSSSAPLCGSEGELVSVSVSVHARDLEALLEALSQVHFPINPQIYHAGVRSQEAAGTQVEFPAYSGSLPEVADTLRAFGFDPDELVRVRSMLDLLPHKESS